jgi:hypothetical protein
MRLILAGLIVMSYGAAQHQTVYEDARVRVLSVQSDPRGSAVPHRHATDYVWVVGSDIHFSRGGANHAERKGEVAIELLQKQTNVHNVCGVVLQGEYEHCREPGSEWLGANLQIQFETDQTRIGILQIAPNATLAIPPADVPPLLIALEGTEAEAVSHANGAPVSSSVRRSVKAADVLRWPADQISEIRNTGKTTARFLVVEFGGPGE